MNKLKEILKRKIDFIRKSYFNDGFPSLIMEFELFVSNTPELVPIMQKLVDENRIPREFLVELVMISMIHHGMKGEKIPPLFYTKEIESKYKIFRELLDVMQKDVEALKKGEKFNTAPLSEVNAPERRKMRFNVFKIYNDIIEEIELTDLRTKDEKKDSSKLIGFEEDKSVLLIGSKKIRIRKFSDQFHALRIMFESSSEIDKEWFFSEIAERVDEKNANEKRYYNAFYQVRLKLKSVGLSDFFISTRQSIKISPKYLS